MATNSKLSQALKGNDNAKKNGGERLSVGGFFANHSAGTQINAVNQTIRESASVRRFSVSIEKNGQMKVVEKPSVKGSAVATKDVDVLGEDAKYISALASQTKRDVQSVAANTTASVKNEALRRADNTLSHVSAAASNTSKSIENMRKRLRSK